jgi:tetratricopeptide (TPR) repeat protein
MFGESALTAVHPGGSGLNWVSLARGGRHRIEAVLLCAATAIAAWGQAGGEPAEWAEIPLAGIQGAPAAESGPARGPEDDPQVQAHCQAARQHLEDRQFEEAVTELDAALSLAHGACYDVLYLMAEAKLGLGHYGEARLAAEHAVALRPGAVDAHFLLGRMFRAQGNEPGAIAHFRTVTLAAERQPDNPQVTVAWYRLGECLAEAGYLRAAAEALERFDRAVWEERPEHRQAAEVAAILKERPYGAIDQRLELLRRGGRPAEMVQAAERATRTRPQEAYLARLYVRTMVEAGQAAQAFEFCRQRLGAVEGGGQAPSAAAAGLSVSLALETACAANRLDRWVSELAGEVTQGRQADLARRLAGRLDEQRDYQHSIPLWRALAEARPEDSAAAWALASALKASGNLAGAVDSLIAFVRPGEGRPPQTPGACPLDRLAAWMCRFQDTGELLRLVTERTGREGCDFATYTVLGATAAAAGQGELAERLFTAALEDRPGFWLAHLAWGQMLLSAYRWEEALKHAEQSLAESPGLAAAHLLRAEACTGLDDYDQAEKAYKAALEADPGEVTYVLALARHYRRTGNLLAAQRYLQQAWSMEDKDHLCPTRGEVVEELIDSYLEGGKTEIARAVLKEAEASDVSDDVLRRVRTALQFASAPMQAEHLAELTRQFEQFPEDVSTGLKLAAGLYMDYQVEQARSVLQQVQARAPDDERLTPLLARVHLRLLENQPAIRLLEEAARRYPRRQTVLRLLADAYLAEFRVDDARETFQRLLTLDLSPDQREAVRVALLTSYLEFSDLDAALELVDQWMAAEPADDGWPRAKLRVLLTGKRYDEAVGLATERLDPVSRRFEELRGRYTALADRLRAGESESQRRTPEEADLEAQLKNLERDLTACATELYGRRGEYVQVCLDAGRYEPAVQQVRVWLADQPEQPQLQQWLIELLLAAEKGDQALEVVGQLVPRTPADVVQAFVWRAGCLAASGKLEDAVKELTSLLEEGFVRDSPSARTQVRQELLTLLLDAKRPADQAARGVEQALALCDRWLADLPLTELRPVKGLPETDRAGRVEVLTLKRFVLGAAERLDEQSTAETISVLQELLVARPRDPGLNNDLGYTWADRGEQLERALPMVKLAVAAEPLNAAFLDSLGWVYYKLADFDAARAYLARAVRLRAGQDPVVYDHLGDAEYRLGDRRAAREHWQKASGLLAETEGSPPVERNTRLIASLRGKLAALEQSEPPAVAPTASEQNPGQGDRPPAAAKGPVPLLKESR